jgi:hypothetical protein
MTNKNQQRFRKGLKIMKALLISLFMIAGLQAVHADPVVVGNPNEGTVIANIKDGKDQVKVTTHGILVKDGDSEENKDSEGAAATISTDDKGISIDSGKHHHHDQEGGIAITTLIEDTLVPLFFFLFCLAAILGKFFLNSRNEQRRLDLLKAMVEKGQAVPESVVNQILTPSDSLESEGTRNVYKRTRNAYGYTIAGVSLIVYALATHQWTSESILIPGLVFLCLGAGGLAGIYLPKREEKIVK